MRLAVCLCALLLVASAQADDKTDAKLSADLKSRAAKVRLAAIEEIGRLGEKGKPFAGALCDALLDPDPKCAKAALLALEGVRPDLYAPLVKIVVDPLESAKIAGVRELGELRKEARPAIKVLVNGIRQHITINVPPPESSSSRTVPAAIYEAIKYIQPDDEETLKLIEALASPGGVAKVMLKLGKKPSADAGPPTAASPILQHRAAALACLVEWAGTDDDERKKVVPFLKAGLDNEATLFVCVKTLGTYGRLSKAHLPELKALKLSPNAYMREVATRAVELIEEDVAKDK